MSNRFRTEAERAERHRTLVEAAESLLAEFPYHRVRVEDVARRAGVAKGTVFLYFASKEALVLAVLRSRAARLFDQVDQQLADVAGGDEEVARLLCEIAFSDPLSLRLSSLYPTVLEPGVHAAEAQNFLAWVLGRSSELAGRIGEIVPGVDGVAVLRRTFTTVMGTIAFVTNDPPARRVGAEELIANAFA